MRHLFTALVAALLATACQQSVPHDAPAGWTCFNEQDQHNPSRMEWKFGPGEDLIVSEGTMSGSGKWELAAGALRTAAVLIPKSEQPWMGRLFIADFEGVAMVMEDGVLVLKDQQGKMICERWLDQEELSQQAKLGQQEGGALLERAKIAADARLEIELHEIEVRSDLDPVNRYLQANKFRLASCYELELLRDPGLAGVLIFELEVRSGRATKLRVRPHAAKLRDLADCVQKKLKRMRFGVGKDVSWVVPEMRFHLRQRRPHTP